jgi:hypothetical protein
MAPDSTLRSISPSQVRPSSAELPAIAPTTDAHPPHLDFQCWSPFEPDIACYPQATRPSGGVPRDGRFSAVAVNLANPGGPPLRCAALLPCRFPGPARSVKGPAREARDPELNET